MFDYQKDQIILVNDKDEDIGTMDKKEVHEKGLLHRAISVFVFNNKKEVMLQRRASCKYHSGGLWANTTCSHPKIDESPLKAAHRRIREEMGFKSDLKKVFSFIYKTDVGQGLIEHELDHVFVGKYNGEPSINKDEVQDYRWISLKDLNYEIEYFPHRYAPWLKIILKEHFKKLET